MPVGGAAFASPPVGEIRRELARPLRAPFQYLVAQRVPREPVELPGGEAPHHGAHPRDERERREQRLRPERSAEHPQLDGRLVLDVHRLVAVVAGRPVDEAGGRYPPLVALRGVRASRPSVQLLAPPSAENRKGLEQPVDEGEHLVLCERLSGRALPEVRPAHVHVQAACPRVVAPHARVLGGGAYRAPERLALR